MKNLVLLLFCTVLASSQLTFANNIQIANVTTTGQNISAGPNNAANFTMVQFDLSWDNSWRTNSGPSNWDAAWVFVKYRVGVNDPVINGASSSGTTVTVSSTANLRVGMPVVVTSGTGAFAANTVISSITNATQFVVSASPTPALNGATITCRRIWEHATLNTTSGNHTAAAGSTIDVPADGIGVFVYRSAAGSGTNNFTGMQLRWQYGTDGMRDDAALTVQVFAIEMVNVPGGVDFNVGGGGGSLAFTSTTINTGVANTVPAGTGTLGGQAGGYPTGQTAPNANWPNGYNAFYCMKYEISQGQYRDFLNTLTYRQQVTRTTTAPTSAAGTGALTTNATRNGIDIRTPGNATTFLPAVYACNLNNAAPFNHTDDGEWIACNFLEWMHGMAYLDWAGLRPMTELEFEKACRGNQLPVNGEYAWGTSSINPFTNTTLINPGAVNEVPNDQSSTLGNANFSNSSSTQVQGPVRVGLFANSNSGRVSSGATYYGIMEMSGNLWEQVVDLTDIERRNFTGVHGNGILSLKGNANQSFWPGMVNGELVNFPTSNRARGGDWGSHPNNCTVSRRNPGGLWSQTNVNINSQGMRGVRSAQ